MRQRTGQVSRVEKRGKPRTLGELVDYGKRRFISARLTFGHGTTNAWDEAAWLAMHALRLPPDRFKSLVHTVPDSCKSSAILGLFERRISTRMPAAYLTREAWLGNLRFYVDERVLVPRSYIAELLFNDLSPWITNPARIRSALDLCTGSGCLAVMLARCFPHANIDASDISKAALDVARRNISNYRLQRRIRLVHSDLFDAIKHKRYDLIVANPPYVRASSMRRLPPEFRHEPDIALAGGMDGLDVVCRIIAAAPHHLNPGGLLVVEAGRSRRTLESKFRKLEFTWPELSGDEHCVFLIDREQLLRHGPPATRARQADH
jgi:ribosomal protein L3 glutamine methyltransferase